MSDGTSTEHVRGIGGGERQPSPEEEQSTAPATPPPLVDPAAPPAIGDPMTPIAGEPAALAEQGGPAEPVAKPLAAFEPMLPTVAPPSSAHLDHALAQAGGSAGHIRVECPNCGSLWQGNDLRPHAEWFCGTCDFPLFWARSGGQGLNEADAAFARMPGTDGREAMLSLACPACGEKNPPVPTANCLRCGAALTEPAPVVEVAVVPPVVVVPPAPVPRRRIWPWVVATGVLAMALIVAIVVAVNRG